MRPHVNGESEGRAALIGALVAEEGVDGHHLQVQRVLSGSRHGAGQHQHGADVVDLLAKIIYINDTFVRFGFSEVRTDKHWQQLLL